MNKLVRRNALALQISPSENIWPVDLEAIDPRWSEDRYCATQLCNARISYRYDCLSHGRVSRRKNALAVRCAKAENDVHVCRISFRLHCRISRRSPAPWVRRLQKVGG